MENLLLSDNENDLNDFIQYLENLPEFSGNHNIDITNEQSQNEINFQKIKALEEQNQILSEKLNQLENGKKKENYKCWSEYEILLLFHLAEIHSKPTKTNRKMVDWKKIIVNYGHKFQFDHRSTKKMCDQYSKLQHKLLEDDFINKLKNFVL